MTCVINPFFKIQILKIGIEAYLWVYITYVLNFRRMSEIDLAVDTVTNTYFPLLI